MTTGRRARGMTLIEVLVSSAVGLIVLASIATLLARGLNAWAVGQRRAAAQQSGLLAMHLMTCELQLSDIKSVTIYPTADMPGLTAISFLSGAKDGAMQHDPYGEILWQKFVVYYFDTATATLRRREEPVAAPELPDYPLGRPVKDPDPLTISSFHPDPDDHVVTKSVLASDFHLPAFGGNPVTVALQTGDDTYSSNLSSAVVMENGFLKANPLGHIFLNRAFVIQTIPTLVLPP